MHGGRATPPCKLPPWTKVGRETRARCVFTRLGLRGFWGGERVGREEIESREEVGSRGPESVDCGALARLDQSYVLAVIRAVVCARVCVSRGFRKNQPDPRRAAMIRSAGPR